MMSTKVVNASAANGVDKSGNVKTSRAVARYSVLIYKKPESALDAQEFSGNKLKDGVVKVLTPEAVSSFFFLRRVWG